MAVVQTLQKEVNNCKVDLLTLSEKVNTLELAFKESTNSTINREIIFRQSVDASLAGLKNYVQEALEKLKRAIKDSMWEKQIKKLCLTSADHRSAPLYHHTLLHSPCLAFQTRHPEKGTTPSKP